ncbi:MAG TPA: addiction module protein [Gammaproteobacteria bacterium]|nr:addiction module protein [Gammaproteobacteria bacterium]
MPQSQDNIEAQALKLPRSERAKVALHLLDSLEQEQPSASHNSLERAWIDESVKRLEAYRRGEMAAFSVDEVIAELKSLNIN